jgi:hypothetical protein
MNAAMIGLSMHSARTNLRSRQRAVGDAAIHHELSRCQVSIEIPIAINQAQIEKGVEVGPVLYERL